MMGAVNMVWHCYLVWWNREKDILREQQKAA